MSNMSELSIAASTTRNEGPCGMDTLAHELAHVALQYVTTQGTTAIDYARLRDYAHRFGDAVFVMEQSTERNCLIVRLPAVLAQEFAHLCADDNSSTVDRDRKLNEFKRAIRGLQALGAMGY